MIGVCQQKVSVYKSWRYYLFSICFCCPLLDCPSHMFRETDTFIFCISHTGRSGREKKQKKTILARKCVLVRKCTLVFFSCLCPRYFRVLSYTLNNNIDQLNLEINILYSKNAVSYTCQWLFLIRVRINLFSMVTKCLFKVA